MSAILDKNLKKARYEAIWDFLEYKYMWSCLGFWAKWGIFKGGSGKVDVEAELPYRPLKIWLQIYKLTTPIIYQRDCISADTRMSCDFLFLSRLYSFESTETLCNSKPDEVLLKRYIDSWRSFDLYFSKCYKQMQSDRGVDRLKADRRILCHPLQ